MGELFPHLCKPIKIGNVQLKNRMVAAPMGSMLAALDGSITDRLIEHHQLRAKGGYGLVVTEVFFIRGESRLSRTACVGREYSIGLAELAEAIHEGGAKAAIQLGEPGGTADARWTGVTSMAPSTVSVRSWVAPPREMTEEEILKLMDQFAEASLIAERAGFDMIMLHGAHGLIVHQFMTPFINRRKDKWGDPSLFPTELIKRVKASVRCPVYVRISGDDFLDPEGKPKIHKNQPTGPYQYPPANLELMARLAVRLEEAGADAIDVSAGNAGSLNDYWIMQPLYRPRGVIVYLAEAIKKLVKVPVITAGRLCDPRLCENIVARGRADMIAHGRVAYADPEFPKKVMEDRPEDIRMCTACDLGCTARAAYGQGGAKCAINYAIGRLPHEYDLIRSHIRKKMMVVGGGIAGMEAARVASLRGFDVIVYEKDTELGGNITRIASRIPRLNTRDLNNIAKWLIHELEKRRVPVRLGVEVTPELVGQEKPDIVIVATGASPYVPKDLRGNPKVIILDDYLAKSVNVTVGKKIAVVGGHHGAEIACSFRREGKEVALIEEGSKVAQAPYLTVRGALLRSYLREEGVKILTEVKVDKITEQGVEIIDKEGGKTIIIADTVIIALERIPNKELTKKLKAEVPELYEVGDCIQPKHMLHAIHSAYRIVREIPDGRILYPQ